MTETSPPLKDESGGQALSVANPAGTCGDQLLLPKFIVRLPDGLHVSLPALDSPTLFRTFVESIFSAGMRFSGLDHACLQKLQFECEQADIIRMSQDLQAAGKPMTLRLAADIVPFPPERVQCYRDPKPVDGGQMEYLFEPVMIESVTEEPVYGEPGPDGTAPIIDQLIKTVSTPAILDVDEFIAAMWGKNIRFGIDVAAVRKALAGGKSERVIVARMTAPIPGRDASVAELSSSLRRDDTPKMLADGRIDLHQFQNRFPQVAKDTRLIRKIPRVPGKSGCDIQGHELTPEIPLDIDITQKAGPGTRIERTADGEFVVADKSGFLQIDPASGAVSITEKIINREGVSLHTTGNLTLSGDEYEEHGEVEELTRIEGKHMTFMANVFGNIVSHGGRVVFMKNLTAGSVKSPGGTLVVEGQTSRATLEAIDGEITLRHAEGCVIIGKKVSIGTAINCDVLAEELTVETSEGSALAARRMQVGTATARRDSETTISMLIPDLSAYAKKLDELKHKQEQFDQLAEIRAGEVDAITSQQDVKNYSIISAKIRSHEINMSDAQNANWQKLLTRVTPQLRHLKTFNDELQAARNASRELAGKIEHIAQDCQAMSADISCKVASIAGDTVIRTLKIHLDAPSMQTLQARELRARLRESGADSTILFNGSDGEFEWAFSRNGGEGPDSPT